MTTGPRSSSLPETSQSQCGQASQEPPTDELRDDTESSDSEQESEPELPGDVKEPRPTTSSRKYAVPKGPNGISRSRDKGPVQPGLKTFPRTQFGTRKRAFNSSWYKDNSWLEYSESQDSTYCFACRHFSLPNTSESAFTSQAGFCNWKKALLKDSGFKLHSKADHHFNAMYAWNEYQRSVDGNSSMLDVTDEERKKKVEENCAYIKTIADVLLLTATQNIAQRGHRESDESQNKGHFLVILDEIAKHDPLIEKRMTACSNAI
ncbi:uncharacterized protein LOC130429020 [Triplophysa dalaica]|uniref:uncharacterized protein LOC130429020 n=1 Tax=Triplophysa dalaica TaxID=1582913 RepID=UPI0024DFA817|nr:uncharacterized protein LOC130429020 [Triplophysa dalaica]